MSIEAMKLALEALEKMVLLAEHEGWEGFDKQYTAITALRHAIAKATEGAAIRCPLCNYQHGHAIGCANNPVDQELARIAKANGGEV